MSEKPDFLIYGSPVSPFVRKVAAMCIEKGVDFELEAVDIFNPPPEFLEISPVKLIPVLRDRSIASEGKEGTIADSAAICAYIEKKHPDTALYPVDPYAHGRAIFLEQYAGSVLARATGLGIFRPIFFSIRQGKEPDLETARESWQKTMPGIFDYLETSLGSSEYLVGDKPTIADISVTCCLMQASLVAETPLQAWPGLNAHFEKMKIRPSIAEPFGKADRFIRKALPERFDLT